jgi:hypothetical protein
MDHSVSDASFSANVPVNDVVTGLSADIALLEPISREEETSVFANARDDLRQIATDVPLLGGFLRLAARE